MNVYISHAPHDTTLATHIQEMLMKDGHGVWLDKQRVEDGSLQPEMNEFIRESDAVVVLWSVHAQKAERLLAEIATATHHHKNIIPLQVDTTPLPAEHIKGVLSISFGDVATGLLLLQRGLLLLLATEPQKTTPWFRETFGGAQNIKSYLNMVHTYPPAESKAQWVARREKLQQENEYIRQQVMPGAIETMEKLQYMLQHLEGGNVPLATLQEWHQWCMANAGYYPELMHELRTFLEHDIQRLQEGGVPVSVLDADAAAQTIEALDAVISSTKEAAYEALFQKIKSFAGLFLNDTVIDTIVNGYLHYVTGCPALLATLLWEAQTTKYVAAKEAVIQLLHYLQNNNTAAKQQQNLEAYFDDAYLINHTAQLLIEAKLVDKEILAIDTIAVNLVDKYVVFILDHDTKLKLDAVLLKIRTGVGLKKDEINWGQAAALAIGASAVAALFAKTQGGADTDTTESSSATYFKEKVAEFNARFGSDADANN